MNGELKQKDDKEQNFNTLNEMLFILCLGSLSKDGKLFSRLGLLLRYKSALMKRYFWAQIDRERVLKYLDDQIATAQQAEKMETSKC